jgi:hypothetical protein
VKTRARWPFTESGPSQGSCPEKRAKLTHDLGQKMYSGYHGVMLGMKSTTWAVSKKVG